MYIKKLFEVYVRCLKCQQDKQERDFFGDKTKCARCIHEEKKSLLKSVSPQCKICKKDLTDKNNKRIKYCCDPCREEGAKKHRDAYWFKKIMAPQGNFSTPWGLIKRKKEFLED